MTSVVVNLPEGLQLKIAYDPENENSPLLINLSCKSASKPLHVQYCTWAKSHHGRHYDWASYTEFIRFSCTPTQHVQSKPSSVFALRHWLPK